jgi:hypothetical protein
MYLVEVRYAGQDFAEPMAELRAWLDACRIEPSLFTLNITSKDIVFRLRFATATDADAVLCAFGAQSSTR